MSLRKISSRHIENIRMLWKDLQDMLESSFSFFIIKALGEILMFRNFIAKILMSRTVIATILNVHPFFVKIAICRPEVLYNHNYVTSWPILTVLGWINRGDPNLYFESKTTTLWVSIYLLRMAVTISPYPHFGHNVTKMRSIKTTLLKS